ncbi:hypothetical protein GPECTOR_101g38 [Gonium pectorale]|uniref:Uncharacterized protein n=1 Tax=Gonium pectorale TaxID=33097 RepID=A0A150FZX0_GONPE|nr:hypothetical protein GPECTOR_101g38 [Gonium pectorale]|eukprot:KXZ43137.1 hypothetical protein GPECTOR_101g38 [Gonium pectorale]
MILQELDQNGDGVINAAELVNMLDGVVKARRERRYMFFVIAALCVFCLCTVGAVVGLTYAVVDALKDTQVTGDTMYVKGSSVEVVRTGSAEFAVVDGVFVNRQAQALANANSSSFSAASNTTTPSPNAVMRAASYMGTPQPFTSRVDVRALMELKYLYVSTITLDDTVVMFSTDMADVFAEAGFKVSRNRRILLGGLGGLGGLVGWVGWVAGRAWWDMTVFNLPSTDPRPSLSSKNYIMKLQIFEACVLPTNTSLDRCIRVPKDKPVGTGSDNAGPGDFIEDIAGVVLIDGERFVSHNETVVRWEGASRVEYEYALVQGYVKVEVVPAGSTTVHKWQQMVASDGKQSDDRYLFCSDFVMPSEFMSAMKTTDNRIANFSYLGLDVMNGRRAKGWGSEVVAGRVHIHVREYHPLTADSPEASPEVFKIPAESECVNTVSVPRLLSPFELRDVTTRVNAEPEAGRQVAAV